MAANNWFSHDHVKRRPAEWFLERMPDVTISRRCVNVEDDDVRDARARTNAYARRRHMHGHAFSQGMPVVPFAVVCISTSQVLF